MVYVHTLVIFVLLSWFSLELISAQKNFTNYKIVSDSEKLVTTNGVFEAGFFSPKSSTDRYMGIWYSQKGSTGLELEVVWVANRDSPLNDSSGVLVLSLDGNLRVLNDQNKSFWSSNLFAFNSSSDSVLQFLDNGNLALVSDSSGSIRWQSFDHPTDTFLPEMSFTIDSTLDKKQELFRSWKSPSDPSKGNFSVGVSTRTPPEVFLLENDRPIWRNGPWNGNLFVGSNSVLSIVNDNQGKTSFGFSLGSEPGLQHFVVSYDGSLIQRNWDNVTKKWEITWTSRRSNCDVYGKCGAFGSCKPTNSPICSCLQGFEPTNNTEWSKGNWTSGCVRRAPLQCLIGLKTDGFSKMKDVEVPDNAVWLSISGEDECLNQCQGTCSCLAYAYYSSIGCMTWNGSLIDIQEFTDNRGIDLNLRLASTELAIPNQQPTNEDSFKRKSLYWKIIVVVVIGGATLLGLCMYYLRIKCSHRRHGDALLLGDDVEYGDLPRFKFESLVIATNNFQESNKLGRGGFGTVYKGILESKEEVAIKRLSNVSGQGLKEFMTEVVVIAKLQHRNLVRLLGCCAEGEEKMLVYEYMPNKSLDALLFDPHNRESLDWKTRFDIIQGICRGLLYLHRDSRLRIIHRDLKASNILLDGNLVPKISDFGMARIFGGNEDQANTNRVVGTYGYMSPEYAMEGRFSEKSDVFSLGVLLLEIVSGRRNGSFKDDESLTLVNHAWKLWNEENVASLIDPIISELSCQAEILRCIQVALLCVQELPEDRPNISMIISMIDNEVSDLPHPTQPGFTQRRKGHEHQTVNILSLSSLSGR